ncbi:MAG: hypothetical protein RH859_00575 [Longimicrobiales bacterium]
MMDLPVPTRRPLARGLLGTALLVAVGACTTVVQGPSPGAAVAPQLTVERFLQASNTRDLDAMSRLFGTANGPIGDTGSTFGCAFKKMGSWFGGTPCQKRSEVELRLDAIARLLQHQDYTISGEEPVAGRSNPTRRVFVTLRQGQQQVSRLPFEVVRTGEGRWLVERVDLERVMAGAR